MSNITMKINKIFVCFLLSAALLACVSQHFPSTKPQITRESDTWDRYIKKDINEIKDVFQDLTDFGPNGTVIINARAHHYPIRFIAVYLDQYRNMSNDNRTMLKYWGESMQIPSEFIAAFKQELHIEHKGQKYWFPVQSSLVTFLRKEMQKGDRIELYTMLLGTMKTEKQVEWIFIINEFQKV